MLFVSYSRRDGDFVSRLVRDLRAQGHNVWRDQDNIQAGENWDNAVEQALRECYAVLLVATPRAVASENVMDEVGFARDYEKTVITLFVEQCELPLRVRRRQWIDFQTNYEIGFEQLIEQLTARTEELPATLPPQLTAGELIDEGLRLRRDGDLDGAIDVYTKAVRLDPESVRAYNNRGFARKAQGDLEGAIADYTEAIRLGPNAIRYNNRGVARKAQGDLEGAIADYTEAIRLFQENKYPTS